MKKLRKPRDDGRFALTTLQNPTLEVRGLRQLIATAEQIGCTGGHSAAERSNATVSPCAIDTLEYIVERAYDVIPSADAVIHAVQTGSRIYAPGRMGGSTHARRLLLRSPAALPFRCPKARSNRHFFAGVKSIRNLAFVAQPLLAVLFASRSGRSFAAGRGAHGLRRTRWCSPRRGRLVKAFVAVEAA